MLQQRLPEDGRMDAPTYPSSAGGRTTQEVGFFDAPASVLARWFIEDEQAAASHTPAWKGLADAVRDLASTEVLTLRAFVPLGSWTLLPTDGPNGTDVGLLHSHATRSLGCLAIRAVCADGVYPAVIMEVCAADGGPPLMLRRSVVAANDGGRWVFEETGPPFEFEHVDRYRAPRKVDRFPPEMLYEHLRALGVPLDAEPDWEQAIVVRA